MCVQWHRKGSLSFSSAVWRGVQKIPQLLLELLSCVNDFKVQRAAYTDLCLSACPPSGVSAQPLLMATEWSPGKYSTLWKNLQSIGSTSVQVWPQVMSWENFNPKVSGSGQMWKLATKLSKPGGCSAVESSVFPQGRSPLHTVPPFTGAIVF